MLRFFNEFEYRVPGVTECKKVSTSERADLTVRYARDAGRTLIKAFSEKDKKEEGVPTAEQRRATLRAFFPGLTQS